MTTAPARPKYNLQTFGLDAAGLVVHCGPRFHKGRFGQRAAQRLQDEWETWADTIAAKSPVCPTAQSRGRTVAVQVHPIGEPEACRTFKIKPRAAAVVAAAVSPSEAPHA